MLTKPATARMLRRWRADYPRIRPLLSPNRKTAEELLTFLAGKYPLVPLNDERARALVIANMLANDHLFARLPREALPRAETFTVARAGAGESLYAAQEALFSGMDIFVGIEMNTGHFHVEGSGLLWDTLFAFRGLDERDLENVYLVSEYAACRKRLGLPLRG